MSTPPQWREEGPRLKGTRSGAVWKEPRGPQTTRKLRRAFRGRVGERVLFPTPSQRARRARAQPRPPQAERSGGGGGSCGGKRRRKARRGHCYSGTKTHGTGTPGAGERDPPPAAPCWKRAAPGQPRPRGRAGGPRAARAKCGGERQGRRGLLVVRPRSRCGRPRRPSDGPYLSLPSLKAARRNHLTNEGGN